MESADLLAILRGAGDGRTGLMAFAPNPQPEIKGVHVQSFFRRSTPEVDIDELETLMGSGDVRVVDVREDWEYKRGRVPGAVHVPLAQLPAHVAGLPRDKRILVICESGSRSLAATDFLLKSGFVDTASVRGGTSAWARSRRPLEVD